MISNYSYININLHTSIMLCQNDFINKNKKNWKTRVVNVFLNCESA